MKDTCLAIYSRCVNAEAATCGGARRILSVVRGMGSRTAKLFAAYVEAKQQQNVLDYDDLLLCWAQMMMEPALAEEIAGRFDHIMVDEYQDTNRLQASILLASSRPDAGSRSSATTRSRSIRFVRRRSATSGLS